jgi:hypothetical protein
MAGAADLEGGMTMSEDTVARELLASARSLIDRVSVDTSGLWPRAAVLLTRQSLEVALKTYWSAKARGAEECPTRAQILCLGAYAGDHDLGRRAGQVWAALSRASHVHPYELAPTCDEFLTWIDTVSDVVDKTERGWR